MPGARPAELATNRRLAGVTPDGGTESQAALAPIAVTKETPAAEPNGLVTETFCSDRLSEPTAWSKRSAFGATEIVSGAVIVSVTGIDRVLLPAVCGTTFTVPRYVPGASAPKLATPTDIAAGVVPLVGAATSQLPPAVVLTAMLKPVLALPLEIETF